MQPKIEPCEAESSNILATIQESGSQDESLNRRPVLQLITNDSKPNWPFSYGGSTGSVSHEDDETPSPDGADDIAANIRALQYYPYSEHFRKSYYGVPKMHVGSVALEPLNSLPIDVSVRNAQLLHFCESLPKSQNVPFTDEFKSSKGWLLSCRRLTVMIPQLASMRNGCHL